jgi:spore maturation protein CgeB
MPPEPAFAADRSYLGTFAADRQDALERLFVEPARRQPRRRFVIGGAQYPDEYPWAANIHFVRHLAPAAHPAFYGSSRLTLNVTRGPMAALGWCPSGRLFEAAACGVPIVTDRWRGLEDFFTPGDELLVADTTEDVILALQQDDGELRLIAERARRRVIQDHTAERRAAELVSLLESPAGVEA